MPSAARRPALASRPELGGVKGAERRSDVLYEVGAHGGVAVVKFRPEDVTGFGQCLGLEALEVPLPIFQLLCDFLGIGGGQRHGARDGRLSGEEFS